jgi:putative Holliday junction resolvase
MRAVGIDLGERRIGVAVSDSNGVLASPYTVVERSGDKARDRRVLAEMVTDLGGEVLVVGMPLSMNGTRGPAAVAAEEEALALASVVTVPVETFDERLTTVEANRMRRERGPGTERGRGGGRTPRTRRTAGAGRAAREGIDAEAAAVMLGAWLEARR